MSEELTEINSNEKISKSGYYAYSHHVGEDCGVPAVPMARRGLFLAKGSIAPDLGTCGCVVTWKLILVAGRE